MQDRTDNSLLVKHLGLRDYLDIWQKMKLFTQNRDHNQQDEFWVLEHPPVFTQGQAGKPEHILAPGGIPVVQSDRGGQVTYHGPGQLILYTLVSLQRRKLSVHTLIRTLEQAVVDLLKGYGIEAKTQCNAPGVYVDDCKIASLGLRVKRGSSYHGLSLNIDMDLEPFQRINPCGYAGLKVTQISEFKKNVGVPEVGPMLVQYLANALGYTQITAIMEKV